MVDWNYARILEIVADELPDAPAQIQGERHFTWREFDRRANALAGWLRDQGAQHDDKIAQYLYNCPEYFESVFGGLKAGLVPVNVNYRYLDDELVYLVDNSDAAVVVFHASFGDRLAGLRHRLPKVRAYLWVDDGLGGARPDWAEDYESIVGAGSDRLDVGWPRTADDVWMLYTGGTTGMPKGVMYRHADLWGSLGGGSNQLAGTPPVGDYDELRERLRGNPGPRMLAACPLMHGTGQYIALLMLSGGGSLVTLAPNATLDVGRLVQTVQDKGVNVLVIVGDAFAKPIVRHLEANPGAYDLSTLLVTVSSGVMWSAPVKEALLAQHPMILIDAYGSSEAIGLGQTNSMPGMGARTATFTLSERCQVLREDGTPVSPGSGEVGRVAMSGFIPLGYYKDEAKTAATFPTYAGVRWSTPGDFAMVEADGSITLLGRGSVSINTGGEKVFPEEVEEALKEHPAVQDAVCVGVPDDRFGEAITALVQREPGVEAGPPELIEHVKARLAGYKQPRNVLFVETIGRSPAGKVDYKALRRHALHELGLD